MERQAITVRGVVQGVGFRPFVYGLASRLHLNGFVQNRTGSVFIEIEGERDSLRDFLEELQAHPPPLSRIDQVQWHGLPVRRERGFRIERSNSFQQSSIFFSPDIATCDECLAELFDPCDRRYRYPLLNCTNCGPRLTIIVSAPYDRERTTMAGFPMCPACQAEYADPANRRFHAQPTACPACGPEVRALRSDGEGIVTNDPLSVFVAAIFAGGIGALKGLGGFHLVCNAIDRRAVRALRRRKHRDEKSFAIMVRDVATARRLCEVDAAEADALVSARRPIVLLRRGTPRPSGAALVADCVAPGNPFLGVMLPYTPLHHLLLEAFDGLPLVMTSGNHSDEPIAYEDHEAVARLGGIADIFLTHDRPIHVRCDDSVTRVVDGLELPVRRSRGYAPQPIKLPLACPVPTVAVGGQLKCVFGLGRDSQAFLSHHLGDLDHFAAYRAFQRDLRLYEQLFGVRPQLIAHDLHPDYASTRYAQRRAAEENLALIGVQHHHAHMASCMAEHGLNEPVIGVTLDGTGYGADGAIWGGEFLVGDYEAYRRAGHLRYVRLPGGDRAIREPWRIGLSHLHDAGCADLRISGVPARSTRTVLQMIERAFNAPLTSSAGRLFDAVAAIAGVRTEVTYEGQAAIQLEWLATDQPAADSYPFELMPRPAEAADVHGSAGTASWRSRLPERLEPFYIDTRPLIRAVVEDRRLGTPAEVIARRFHATMVDIIAAACVRLREQLALNAVTLSGGVFMNALLTRETGERLRSEGFRVYRHRVVPPNDGGLSLGQLAIAACVSRSSPGASRCASALAAANRLT